MSYMIIVTVSRDGWDWFALWFGVLATVAGMAGVGLAVWAIHRANVIARNADQALVDERRNMFELGILTRILENTNREGGGAYETVKGLLLMLQTRPGQEEDLPTFRERIANHTLPTNALLEDHFEEFQQAVNRRMEPTSIQPVRRRRSNRRNLNR